MSAAASRSVLLLCRASPYGSARAREMLDVLMAFAAFDQPVSLLLLDDAVLMLLAQQQDAPHAGRSLARLLGVLPDYGIERIHADAAALALRGLVTKDLLLPTEALDDAAIRTLIAAHDVVLTV